MKIIHSSDIHLDSGYPERTQALEAILSMACEKKADLVLISGDLFNSSAEADKLRPALRNIFSSLPFKVIVIPGNHDMEAYSADLNYGNCIQVIVEKPFGILDFEEVRIAAVPYTNQDFNDILPVLKGMVDPARINILMIHCSLDVPGFSGEEFGEEKKQMYLPVSSRVLAHTGFDYIMAGHFHSRTVENKLSDRSTFLYSGSPVSITRKELARRRVFLLDSGKRKSERITSLELDTFYYENISLNFYPGREDDLLAELRNRLGNCRDHKVELSIEIGGFTAVSENEAKERIAGIIKETGMQQKGIVLAENYRGIGHILEDPLYLSFSEKLKSRDLPGEFKKQMDEAVIMQFSSMRYKK
ncbi:MAG: metallophosphoesterase [Actinobacteria bacterium]|nr:metallophosphoesterase [Actinomycetota bacterium]